MVFKAINQCEALQGHSILYALERLITDPRSTNRRTTLPINYITAKTKR